MKFASIVGFGDLGQQFYCYLEDKKYSNINFFDDYHSKQYNEFSHKFNEFRNPEFQVNDFYVALGYKNLKLKQEILNELILLERNIPYFIHHSSFIHKTALIEAGVFLYPMCNVDINVKLKMGSILNNSVIISHDSIIGSCCYLSPGVVVCGNVTVGDNTFIGAGSIISNGVKIGKNVKIGIGTVVTQNIPDNFSVIGNPMKIKDKNLNL
jgi:sugar O-acyltransferase (sialic acid O-acetyltransferase NeuD family)